jgi:hypothetical protein
VLKPAGQNRGARQRWIGRLAAAMSVEVHYNGECARPGLLRRSAPRARIGGRGRRRRSGTLD